MYLKPLETAIYNGVKLSIVNVNPVLRNPSRSEMHYAQCLHSDLSLGCFPRCKCKSPHNLWSTHLAGVSPGSLLENNTVLRNDTLFPHCGQKKGLLSHHVYFHLKRNAQKTEEQVCPDIFLPLCVE